MIKYNLTKRFLTISIIIAAMFMTVESLTYSGGAPGGNTNAPGEQNCTACHSGTLQTSGTNFNNTSLSGNFTGNGYIPDSTYTITLKFKDAGKSRFGFQITCLNDNNTMAGTFTSTSSRTSITTATISGATRTYVRQTSSGNSGNDSISWSFEWTAPSSNVDTVTFYAIINSTNSSFSTAGDEIIAREFKIGPSNLLPVATASTTNTTPCAGSAVGVQGSATNNPTSWLWSFPGGSPSFSTAQNPNVTYSTSGTKYAILVANNAKGQSKPDTLELSVQSGPSSFIQGAATRTMCYGDSVKLDVFAQTGIKYYWSNGDSGTSIYATTAGTYYVDAVSPGGCSKRSNQIVVEYHAIDTVDLTVNNNPACEGSTIALTATSTISVDSFIFYRDGQFLTRQVSNQYSVVHDSTANYQVMTRDGNGCYSNLDSLEVQGVEKIDGPVIQCANQKTGSVRFIWDANGFHNGFQVSTNGSVWFSPSSGTSGNFHDLTNQMPDDSVDLYVRAIDVAPCITSKVSMHTCVTAECVPLTYIANMTDSLCFGDLLEIEVNGLSNDTFGISIDGGDFVNDTIIRFNVSTGKDYRISVIDSNNLGCASVDTVIPLTVDRIQTETLKPDKLGAYCPGDAITYSALDTSGHFEFYLNDDLVQSGSQYTYTSSTIENNDSLRAIIAIGKCLDTTFYAVVNREMPANAGFSYSRNGSVYSFTPDNSGYSSYTWDFGDGSATSSDVMPTHDFLNKSGESVNVTLEVTTENNCVNDSVVVVDIPDFSNILSIGSWGVKVYPNPAVDALNIDNRSGVPLDIHILGLGGQELLGHQVRGTNDRIDVSSLAPGLYNVRIKIDGQEHTVLLQKH